MKFGHFNDKALPDMLSSVSELPELYKLNSFGYRCPEWSPMPHGKKNVVILGSSHTFGQGLAEDEHWVHFLSKHNTVRLRYWNLAQPGASGDKIVRTLYGSQKIIDPNIVIVCWPDWSRRERYGEDTTDMQGSNQQLRYEDDETDLQNFLKNVFFVEKYAEWKNCMTFHCFASASYHEHIPDLKALKEHTLMNCYPWWETYLQRELQSDSVARDGQHCGIKHHERFAELFLKQFGSKLR